MTDLSMDRLREVLSSYAETMNNVCINNVAAFSLASPEEIVTDDVEILVGNYFLCIGANRSEELRLNNNQHFLNYYLRR